MPNPAYKRSNSLIQADILDMAKKLEKVDCTKLWLQKAKNIFHLLDLDRTGVITQETAQLLAKRFKQYAKLSDDEADTLQQIITDWWRDVFKGQETTTFEETYKIRYVIQTTPEFQEVNQDYAQKGFGRFFDFIDTNHDGIISNKEWRVFFQVLGVHDAEQADETFRKVNLKKDGLMSRDEFLKACDIYINSMEPSEYDSFFGPLEEV